MQCLFRFSHVISDQILGTVSLGFLPTKLKTYLLAEFSAMILSAFEQFLGNIFEVNYQLIIGNIFIS